MKYSIDLPRPDGTTQTNIPALVEVARAAENACFDAVAVTDHPFPFLGNGSVSHRAYDPFTLLSYVAARTERIRLHFSLLVASHRNPFLTAQMIATLDAVSNGRTIIGMGAGYNATEIAALGGDFVQRRPHVDTVVTAMHTAWRGEPVYSEGDRWTAAGNELFPACVQVPHPPLWRGGNAKSAARSAARYFDGWSPLEFLNPKVAPMAGTAPLSLAALPDAVAGFKELWRSAGRIETPEICFVRAQPYWLDEAASIEADVKAIAAAGATWLELAIAGTTHQEHLESVKTTSEVLRAAGLLERR